LKTGILYIESVAIYTTKDFIIHSWKIPELSFPRNKPRETIGKNTLQKKKKAVAIADNIDVREERERTHMDNTFNHSVL